MTTFPSGRFDVILADPPWSYYGSGEKWAAAAKEYGCMSLDDIKALPVAALLEESGIIFTWATCPMLDVAIECLRAWGMVFRGVSFVWVKTRKDGKVIGAQGVRPSITKPTTEMVIAGSRVRRGRPIPVADEGVPQVVLAPRRKHSQKPDEVAERIDRLYPQAKKLEMFCRGLPPTGWVGWGDECTQVQNA